MAFTVLLCTDGSELSDGALAAGMAVVRQPDRVVIAIAVEAPDPMLVVGTGMAGGVMTPVEAAEQHGWFVADGQRVLEATRAKLGIGDAEVTIVTGEPGPSLCGLAETLPASVMVIGTRGHSGFRRAVLGSVSDHIVRHAPCPVVAVNHAGAD